MGTIMTLWAPLIIALGLLKWAPLKHYGPSYLDLNLDIVMLLDIGLIISLLVIVLQIEILMAFCLFV